LGIWQKIYTNWERIGWNCLGHFIRRSDLGVVGKVIEINIDDKGGKVDHIRNVQIEWRITAKKMK